MNITTRKSIFVKWALVFAFVFIPLLALTTEFLYYYCEGGSISFQQALLFVVESMTSTGYGELLPFHSWGMILFTIFLVFGGFGILFIIFTSIATEYIHNIIRESTPTALPRGIKGHVAIIGEEHTSERLARMVLSAGLTPTVMSKDKEFVAKLINTGIISVYGDPTKLEDLRGLALGRASAVVTAQKDEDNVSTVLAMKSLAADLRIYATVDDPHFKNYMEHAGAVLALPIKQALGEALARWVLAPVSETLSSAAVEYPGLHFMELPITPTTPFTDKCIRDIRIREQAGATVLGVWKADSYIKTISVDTAFENGDVILLMADDAQVERLKSICGVTPKELRRPKPGDKCIIVGGGHVGEQAYKELTAGGLETLMVEERPVPVVGVLKGDGTRREVLISAGIMEADALVVCTNGDLQCLMTVLVARSLRPDMTIVARTNSEEYSERLLMAGADFAISLSRVASQRLMNLMTPVSGPLNPTELIGATVPAGTALGDRYLKDLTVFNEFGCMVAVIDSESDTILNPDGEAFIPNGSRITILGEPQQVHALLGKLAVN